MNPHRMNMSTSTLRTLGALVLAALLSAPAGVLAATAWSTDAGSTLEFSASAEDEAFTGRFGRFDAKIVFDPADLAGSSFNVEIDLASADSASAERDEMLLGSEFFDVANTPKATYVATAFRELGAGRFAADGTLTLRGIAKPVVLEFDWSADGGNATLKGQASVNRLAFDVGAGDWSDASTIVHEIGVATSLTLRAQ